MSLSKTLTGLTDEQLIEHYAETEDQAAFKILHDRHYTDLVRFIFNRYIRDYGVAEDVAQKTFLRLHQCCKTYIKGKSFAKWLFWFGGNQAINHSRDEHRQKRHSGMKHFRLNNESFSKDIEPDNADDRDEFTVSYDPVAETETIEVFNPDNGGENLEFKHETIFVALESLSEAKRRVITLLYYEHVSERDVASRMGTTRHQIRSIVTEALADLKVNLLRT